MAGCISCVILPLLLFLFHRYIQPFIMKFWNPWTVKDDKEVDDKNGFSCPLNKCKQPTTEDKIICDTRLKTD